MRIITESRRVTSTAHELCFEWNDCPGAGFSFTCDAAGKVRVDALNPAARVNYESCVGGIFNVSPKGVRTYHNAYTEPAVGLCVCGRRVELGGFTNTCEGCGADYNWNGDRLAARELWDGTDGAGSYGYQ